MRTEIRPEELEDYLEITRINNLAFGRDNEARLIERIRQSDRYLPQLSLVAEVDNKIVGYIIFSYVDLVDKKVSRVLALAPLAVLPEYQNRGIGSLLVNTGLTMAETTSAPLVVVLGHNKFYSRFGFKPAIDYNISSSFDVADEFFLVKFLIKNTKKYRGKIIYSAVFDDI